MGAGLHIAVLECDVPPSGIEARAGSYGDMFEGLIRQGYERAPNDSTEILFSKYDVVKAQEYPSLDEIDAVVLTGSRRRITQPIKFKEKRLTSQNIMPTITTHGFSGS
jgi:hypothetical protein